MLMGKIGEGDALSWEGAMGLQWLKSSRWAMKTRVIPGQNTVLAARAAMKVTP